jgi:hypothetical protein
MAKILSIAIWIAVLELTQAAHLLHRRTRTIVLYLNGS